MLRVPLEQGNVIQLNNQNYTIETVKGDGANCIVYSAYYMDTVGKQHRIYLKECYPYSASIIRQNYGLLWELEEEQQRAFSAFRAAYEKLMIWQNENFSVSVFDLCEANNTLYIIMNADKGTTFDQDNADSLHDILKTIKLLAHFVGRYHENGYLHLDIKPSNFLVYPRPSEHIVLFDMDSVTPISDIENGNVEFISYSEGWAAPEQKQGKISKLCPATDIYSIGAILFEKVMGRPVTVFDTGVFADWDFEGRFFERVNPQIKIVLKKIFKLTLSAAINRRYQSTDELESDLDSIISILTAGEPYLLPEYISCTADFIGRKEELTSIDHAFATGAHIVCLKGMGGIGKSELSRKYAQEFCTDQATAVFTSYRGKNSIAEMLDEIELQNFNGTEKEKLSQLKKLLDEDVLLVVDELDSEEVPDLEILERLKCRILITSRLSWDEYGTFSSISVNALATDEQLALFEQIYGCELLVQEIHIVQEILAMMEGYTLLIPLLAKQMRKGVNSFADTLDAIRDAGIKGVSDGKVRHMKDSSRPLTGSVYNILKTVLDMANFSKDEVYVMRSLALLSDYKITKKEFLVWIGKQYGNQIEELCFRSWIHCDNVNATPYISLHSIIASLCYEELQPSITNCPGVANRLWDFASTFVHWHKIPLSHYHGGFAETYVQPAKQHEYNAFSKMMHDILKKSDWNNDESNRFWVFLIEKATNVLCGDWRLFEDYLKYQFTQVMKKETVSMSYFVRLLLALETIELLNNNGELSLLYAKLAVSASENLPDAEEMKFRVCFILYQYICREYLDFNAYWEIDGFDALVDYISIVWKNVVDEGEIDFETNDIWVISPAKTERDGTTIDAVEQAYKDFVFKVSEEGIEYARYLSNPNNAYKSMPPFDYMKWSKKHVDPSDFEGWFDVDVQTAISLYENARILQKKVVNLVLGNIGGIEDCVEFGGLYNGIVRSEEEKREMNKQLKLLDHDIPRIVANKPNRSKVIYGFADLEAAFVHGYAITDDWESYCVHRDALLKYYHCLIYGKKYDNLLLIGCGLSDIKRLPGASSLANKKGRILPSKFALDLIISIVEIMESYYAHMGYPMDSLCEIFELALDIAKEANNLQQIVHFEKRIRTVTSVEFSRKNKME